MNSNYPGRAASFLVLMSIALTAQVARDRDAIPLKHWPAPLYWQPTQAENQPTAVQGNAAGNADTADNAAASATNALAFVAITACRLADTRTGSGFTGAFGPPSLAPPASRTFPIQQPFTPPTSLTCPSPLPPIARAYSLNVTAIPTGLGPGFVTAYPTPPTPGPPPLFATLFFQPNAIVSNAAIVAAGKNGSVDVYANVDTDLVIDLNGYYVPQTAQSSVTLSHGTASAPALGFTGDPGTGIFSSGRGILNLAAGGNNGVTLNSPGDMTVAGGIHARGPIRSGNSIVVDGTTNSITVDSVPVASGSNINELYIGGDNHGLTSLGYPDVPFDKIKVGIGTRSLPQKLTIFDPTAPAIGLYGSVGGGELAVATCATCYSNVATPGDLVLRTPGGTAKDVILTSRNSNGGGIRFTTGAASFGSTNSETEKMRILQTGFVGIGTTPPPFPVNTPPDPLFAVGQQKTAGFYPFQVDHIGNVTRINDVPYGWPGTQGAPNTVLTNNGSGGLSWAGVVTGSCGLGANYVTKWLSTTSVGCSSIFETATANVGIGTTTPSAKTEILTKSDFTPGASVLRLTNTSDGTQYTETGLAFNIGFGPSSSGPNPNFFAARIYAKYDGSNVKQGRLTLQSRDSLGTFNDTVNVIGAQVGIETITPQATLDVNGTVRVGTLATPAGPISSVCRDNTGGFLTACGTSDARLKTNVTALTHALDKLARIRGVSFNWNERDGSAGPSERKEIGVLAQEVEVVYPELVNDLPEGYKTVSYDKLTAVLIEAVKELKSENDLLKRRIESLERTVVK